MAAKVQRSVSSANLSGKISKTPIVYKDKVSRGNKKLLAKLCMDDIPQTQEMDEMMNDTLAKTEEDEELTTEEKNYLVKKGFEEPFEIGVSHSVKNEGRKYVFEVITRDFVGFLDDVQDKKKWLTDEEFYLLGRKGYGKMKVDLRVSQSESNFNRPYFTCHGQFICWRDNLLSAPTYATIMSRVLSAEEVTNLTNRFGPQRFQVKFGGKNHQFAAGKQFIVGNDNTFLCLRQ